MLRVRIHMGCYGALHNRTPQNYCIAQSLADFFLALGGRWGRLSQPDISPAVWQLGPLTHKRLVAGRQSPLQGDKRLSISTCVTSESCPEQTLTLQCHLRF